MLQKHVLKHKIDCKQNSTILSFQSNLGFVILVVIKLYSRLNMFKINISQYQL